MKSLCGPCHHHEVSRVGCAHKAEVGQVQGRHADNPLLLHPHPLLVRSVPGNCIYALALRMGGGSNGFFFFFLGTAGVAGILTLFLSSFVQQIGERYRDPIYPPAPQIFTATATQIPHQSCVFVTINECL